MPLRLCLFLLAAGLFIVPPGARGASVPPSGAEQWLSALQRRLPRFRPVRLPRTGTLALSPAQSLTVEDLRGLPLDDRPPVVRPPKKPYDAHQTDDFAPGKAPYAAPGIRPFRLREFTAEFNYGGWHNFRMMEYAAAHGFRVIFPYVMPDTSHFPPGTGWLKWGSFVDWERYFAARQIPVGRYDMLAERDVTQDLLASGEVWTRPGPGWIAMLDLEHGSPLSPDDLRGQSWYPAQGTEAAKRAFEQRYYRGYLLTYTAPIAALRRKGWGRVGVYPQPYGSGWYALLGLAEKRRPGLPDPATYWPWLRYGREMALAQDVLYPDVYVYYPSPQNVAYTLARLDFDRALIRTLPRPRPLRPYFWPLLHGGDAGYHWWKDQPQPNEDVRAMFALCFFAGVDGVVLWNWSDIGSHHAPPPLLRKEGDRSVGADVMARENFEARPEGAGPDAPPFRFRRYDMLRVVGVDEPTGVVRFRRIVPDRGEAGAEPGPDRPVCALPREELTSHLRPASEAVAAAVEGLALVRLFEPLLRRGTVQVDVPALDQFTKTLPIVRRVQWGRVHLLATYDPLCIRGGSPRLITLTDFGGQRGRTLLLPADSQVRLFMLME